MSVQGNPLPLCGCPTSPPPPPRESTHHAPGLQALTHRSAGKSLPENLQPQRLQQGPPFCTLGPDHLPLPARGWFFPMNSSHPECVIPRRGWSWPPEHGWGTPLPSEQNIQLSTRTCAPLGLTSILGSPGSPAESSLGTMGPHTNQIRI